MRFVISQSFGRKIVATSVACIAFVMLYEVVMFDSRDAMPRGIIDPTLPAAGARLLFTATAYCKGTTTTSGVNVRTGIAASDPSILPVGSVVNLATDSPKHNGVYTIMDTGPRIQGRILDLYMWSCHDALAFGRRPVEITVLRLGWNPNASTPSLIDRLFRRREARAAKPQIDKPDSESNSESATEGAGGATPDPLAAPGNPPNTPPSSSAPGSAPENSLGQP